MATAKKCKFDVQSGADISSGSHEQTPPVTGQVWPKWPGTGSVCLLYYQICNQLDQCPAEIFQFGHDCSGPNYIEQTNILYSAAADSQVIGRYLQRQIVK